MQTGSSQFSQHDAGSSAAGLHHLHMPSSSSMSNNKKGLNISQHLSERMGKKG
jgi:hypothetical protein